MTSLVRNAHTHTRTRAYGFSQKKNQQKRETKENSLNQFRKIKTKNQHVDEMMSVLLKTDTFVRGMMMMMMTKKMKITIIQKMLISFIIENFFIQ